MNSFSIKYAVTKNYNNGIQHRAIPEKTLLLCLKERERLSN